MWKKDHSIQMQMHHQQIKIHQLEQEREEWKHDKNQLFARIDKLKQEKKELVNMLGEMLRYFEPGMDYPEPHEYLKIPKQAAAMYKKYKK